MELSRQKSLQRIYCSPFTNNSRVGASHDALNFLRGLVPTFFIPTFVFCFVFVFVFWSLIGQFWRMILFSVFEFEGETSSTKASKRNAAGLTTYKSLTTLTYNVVRPLNTFSGVFLVGKGQFRGPGSNLAFK